MEMLRNDMLSVSTSNATNCSNSTDMLNVDELSRQKEDELLYGTGDDGEEEDALSDDSLRLRLSDDEAEMEDVTQRSTSPNLCDKEIKDKDENSGDEEFNKKQQSHKNVDSSEKNNVNVDDEEELEVLKSSLRKTNNLVLNSNNNNKSTREKCYNETINSSTKTRSKSEKLIKTKSGTYNTSNAKNCDDNVLTDNISNSISKEKDKNEDSNQLKIQDQNKEENTSNENDQYRNDKKDSLLSKILSNNHNVTPFCNKKTLSSTSDVHSTVDEQSEDKKEVNSTETTTASKRQEFNQDSFKNDPKIINDKCLKKTYALKNLEFNDKQSMNQSNSEAINVENDDNNESTISADENSLPANIGASSEPSVEKCIKNKNEEKIVDTPKPQRRRRRSRKLPIPLERDLQEKQEGRQKRRTAKNAEEIIRKKFLVHDSDIDSSDNSDKNDTLKNRNNQHAPSLSPPTLKRQSSDIDPSVNGNVKKLKSLEVEDLIKNEEQMNKVGSLNYISKLFRRNVKEKLPKLKQEELEELLIQKIVETIAMRGEIGRLREQAKISEKNQEITRTRCQQLAKQIKDFEMVLNRNAADRRANNDKPVVPIKINRSVGLQVNFITDQGMQSLRQLQQASPIKSLTLPALTPIINDANSSNQRKGIKIRSPRKTAEIPIVAQPVTITHGAVQPPTLLPAVTPTALVMSKVIETTHPVNLQNQSNTIQQLLPNQQQQQPLPPPTVVINGKVTQQQTNRQSATINVSKTKTNDLIDLTDEEEKNKSTINQPNMTKTADSLINIKPKVPNSFPRVIQTLSGNVAITSQPASIRVVHTASHPTPTALVNNMNAPRLAYVMQSGVVPGRQLLIASNSNQIRPVVSTGSRPPPFATVAYKTGISTNANGTVRVITTSAGPPNIQPKKHPAPLPDSPSYAANPLLKLPPPAPSLKISKVANGIVLSWNMTLSDKYADIVSYQLYAYQEVTGICPNTNLWKKVGDVRALPLPMACTLTQFSEGNNYYFAVRAVDSHSRKGQYSAPGNISL